MSRRRTLQIEMAETTLLRTASSSAKVSSDFQQKKSTVHGWGKHPFDKKKKASVIPGRKKEAW